MQKSILMDEGIAIVFLALLLGIIGGSVISMVIEIWIDKGDK